MSGPASLFELAGEIARAHGQSTHGSITVIPVIVDDLAAARPVLRALCDVLQGRFLDTSDVDPSEESAQLHTSVPGSSDPVRKAAVTTALVTTTGRRIVFKEQEGGLLDAELDPPVGAELGGGDSTVVAFARSVVHRDLDLHEFAVIAYQSGGVDLPFRRAIWQLIVDHLAGMPSGTLRTLVVVTEATIDIELHCQTNRGFRFALEGDRLLYRHGRDDLMANVAWISRHHEPFVLFLGAGFAVSSRLPLGDAVRDGAIRRLLAVPSDEFTASQSLAVRFHQWIAEKPGWLSPSEQLMPSEEFARKLTLERVVRAENRLFATAIQTLDDFRIHHDSVVGAPGSAVLDLATVLRCAIGRIILVEVNFDLLVETHAGSPLRVFASDDEFVGAADYIQKYLSGEESDIPLLKMHGTISDPATCVVSEDQTEQGVGAGKLAALKALIGRPEAPRLWVYVGASMRDRDLLRVLASEEFARGLDERWVNPYLVESIDEYARDRMPFWSDTKTPASIQDRMITETADAFLAALAGALEESTIA